MKLMYKAGEYGPPPSGVIHAISPRLYQSTMEQLAAAGAVDALHNKVPQVIKAQTEDIRRSSSSCWTKYSLIINQKAAEEAGGKHGVVPAEVGEEAGGKHGGVPAEVGEEAGSRGSSGGGRRHSSWELRRWEAALGPTMDALVTSAVGGGAVAGQNLPNSRTGVGGRCGREQGVGYAGSTTRRSRSSAVEQVSRGGANWQPRCRWAARASGPSSPAKPYGGWGTRCPRATVAGVCVAAATGGGRSRLG